MQITLNNVELEITRISNTEIFSGDLESSMPEPQVPQAYIEDQDRWIDNPYHPAYNAAVSIFYANRSIAMFDLLLCKNIKVINPKQIILTKMLNRMYPNDDPEYLFLKHILFTDDEDKSEVINLVTLTETRVYYIFNSLKVMRDGEDIHQHDIKNIVHTNIEYEPIVLGGHQLVHPLDEYNACIASNCSYIQWNSNQFSLDLMAQTVALYRLNKLIEIHSSDASQIEQERNAKKHK